MEKKGDILALDHRFAYIYARGGNPIRTAEQIPEKKKHMLEGIRVKDQDWQDTIDPKWWSRTSLGKVSEEELREKSEFQKIHKKLLSFGGSETCFPDIEEDMRRILSRGQLWLGDRTRLIKGEDSRCHANACNLWLANRSAHEIAICTGYALSKDGIWRQHSWLVLRQPRSVEIVETTVRRTAYFGFVMTIEEANKFVDDNY